MNDYFPGFEPDAAEREQLRFINGVLDLRQFDKIFIAYEESAKEGETAVLARELSQVKAGEKILFIFGPEGGISPEEIAAFDEKGGLKIGLGPRIMRAETAPLYALSSVSYALELLKQE